MTNSVTVNYSASSLYYFFGSGLDAAAGVDDSELPNLGGEQSLGLDNSGPKLADFPNRPAGKLH